MKEQLFHILDQSVCLTRRQMKEYLSGTLLQEEIHAVEVHLNSCPLCRLALEGFETHREDALQAIASLNSGFLKEHFDNISPQIHLNSLAPAASFGKVPAKRKRNTAPVWRIASLAAGLLLLFGVVWAWKHRQMSPNPVRSSYGTENPGLANPKLHRQESNMPVKSASAIVSTHSDSIRTRYTSAIREDSVYVDAGFAVKKVAPNVPTLHPKIRREDVHSGAVSTPVPRLDDSSSNTPGQQNDQKLNQRNEVHQTPAPAASSKIDAPSGANSQLESYSKATVEKALSTYLQGMNSSDPQTRFRFMILAAQCYAALGNKPQAETLLQTVIDEAPGRERRAARRALRSLK